MTSSLEIIDLRELHDEELLHAVYSGLYLPAFPIREEQEAPSVWRPLLWGPEQDQRSPILHILVAGWHLRDGNRRTAIGCIYAEFFRASQCGLLTYLAVHPTYRNQGLGKYLLNEAVQTLKRDAVNSGGRLKAVFGEVNNPSMVRSSDDSINPKERLRVMAKLGARLLPIRYVQPGLRPGQGRSRCLLLVAFPIGNGPVKSIPGKTVSSFLSEFYRALGVENPESDRDLQDMLAGLGEDFIELGFLDIKE